MNELFWVKTPNKECYMHIDVMTNSGFISGEDTNGEWNEIELLDSDVRFKPLLKYAGNMGEGVKALYYAYCNKIMDSNGKNRTIVDTAKSIIFLINSGYDAFDLIEQGLAIDSSTILFDNILKEK